uniref:Uncharacterized protein n=1 Tax=Oryza nivara TaxID=4536 RepID=A0A0E0HY30_ORYNI
MGPNFPLPSPLLSSLSPYSLSAHSLSLPSPLILAAVEQWRRLVAAGDSRGGGGGSAARRRGRRATRPRGLAPGAQGAGRQPARRRLVRQRGARGRGPRSLVPGRGRAAAARGRAAACQRFGLRGNGAGCGVVATTRTGTGAQQHTHRSVVFELLEDIETGQLQLR